MWIQIHDNYELSVCGEVKNITTQQILKGFIRGGGKKKKYYYLAVDIGPIRYNIHQLVASKFLPSPTEENCVIDHIDRNRYNNHASNLRWVSRSVNCTNRTIVTKTCLGENHHIQIRKYKPIIRYVVNMIINKQLYYKRCNTLKEAKKYRDEIINNSEYKEKESRVIINVI